MVRLARFICVALVAVAAPASAGEPALTRIEANVAGGVSVGGGSGASATKVAAYTVGAIIDHAIVADPWVTAQAGVFFEGGDRAGVGVRAGVRVHPAGTRTRFGAAIVSVVAPYTFAGVAASAGYCWPFGGIAACADVEGGAFALGDDLAEGTVAAQLQLVLGMRFDVF
ncbi:MAG: hypothetical protein D6689_22850 [Deltaproteobacteria bacterium]|nr:MAG: hypothetical protein D6689_22850 [Deltaproteobacteria bacterium]